METQLSCMHLDKATFNNAGNRQVKHRISGRSLTKTALLLAPVHNHVDPVDVEVEPQIGSLIPPLGTSRNHLGG